MLTCFFFFSDKLFFVIKLQPLFKRRIGVFQVRLGNFFYLDLLEIRDCIFFFQFSHDEFFRSASDKKMLICLFQIFYRKVVSQVRLQFFTIKKART